MSYQIIHGNALDQLRMLPDNSVDCVVTSPPYWQLRDYEVEGQIGIEPSPQEWVRVLVEVFREVRRVMAPHAVAWVNVGDKYMSDGGSGHQGNANSCRAHRRHTQRNLATASPSELGFKSKDLCLLPARLAIALQDDGWYVRQRCIWHKPCPMPESTKDRPTTDYEDIIMLSKSETYFYDSFAVLQPTTGGAHGRGNGHQRRSKKLSTQFYRDNRHNGGITDPRSVRNLRSVWRIPSTPYADEKCLSCSRYYDTKEKRTLQRDEKDRLVCLCGVSDKWIAHFATFPQGLADICIRASTSAFGCCVWCGCPVERIVERARVGDWNPDGGSHNKPGQVGRNRFKTMYADKQRALNQSTAAARAAKAPHDNPFPAPKHLGWRHCCPMNVDQSVRPSVVLDPFGGAMTTALVSEALGRDSISIELNADYIAMGRERIARAAARREVAA